MTEEHGRLAFLRALYAKALAERIRVAELADEQVTPDEEVLGVMLIGLDFEAAERGDDGTSDSVALWARDNRGGLVDRREYLEKLEGVVREWAQGVFENTPRGGALPWGRGEDRCPAEPDALRRIFRFLIDTDADLDGTCKTALERLEEAEAAERLEEEAGQGQPDRREKLALLSDQTYMTHKDFSEELGLDARQSENLKKALHRFRHERGNSVAGDWREVAEPRPREPRFVFRVRDVRHIVAKYM